MGDRAVPAFCGPRRTPVCWGTRITVHGRDSSRYRPNSGGLPCSFRLVLVTRYRVRGRIPGPAAVVGSCEDHTDNLSGLGLSRWRGRGAVVAVVADGVAGGCCVSGGCKILSFVSSYLEEKRSKGANSYWSDIAGRSDKSYLFTVLASIRA